MCDIDPLLTVEILGCYVYILKEEGQCYSLVICSCTVRSYEGFVNYTTKPLLLACTTQYPIQSL